MSLMLDMSSLGSVEPIQPVRTPRDITLKSLRTSSHVLRREELQQRAQSLAQLQEEFSVGCSAPHTKGGRGWQWWGLAGVDITEGGSKPSCAPQHLW